MQIEKMIREQITQKVMEISNKKVRNVFFLCRTDNNKIAYCIEGNNKVIFGVAMVDANGNIELII